MCPVCERTVVADASRPAIRCTILTRQHGGAVTRRIAPICHDCLNAAQVHGRPNLTRADGQLEAQVPTWIGDTRMGQCEACGIHVKLPVSARRKVVACSAACRAKRYHPAVEKCVTACKRCGRTFTAQRGARYCSGTCRQSAHRNRHR